MKIEERLESAGNEVRIKVGTMAVQPAPAVRRTGRRHLRFFQLAATAAIVMAVVGAGVLIAGNSGEEETPNNVIAGDQLSVEATADEGESQFDQGRISAIQAALADGTLGSLDLDPPPTDGEIAEAVRRNRVKAEATPTVLRQLIGDEYYAGQWFDSTTGTLFVAITPAIDPEEVKVILAELDADPTVVVFTYSYDELQNIYDELLRRKPENSSIGLYPNRNKVGIAIDEPDAIDVSGIPSDAIFFEPYPGHTQLDLLNDDSN